MSDKFAAGSKQTLNIFMLAGEASGDIIGADLIEKLNPLVDLKLSGVGGQSMIEKGLTSLFPITDLSVMGYVDVIIRLPLLLYRVRQVVRHILQVKPDIVVLIDSQVFSNLVAKGLKRQGFTAPILLYVCPTVWGYKPERARHIRQFYNEVLAILPFEPAVMKNLGGPPCRYVGHPALSQSAAPTSGSKKQNIILMPGSRKGELRRHLPMLKDVAMGIAHRHPKYIYTLITLPHLVEHLKKQTQNWGVPIDIVSERHNRPEVFARSKIAIVVAGTATLEMAVANVPMVVSYVMDVGQLQIKNSINIKHFALPNLIMDQQIVPELLFEKPNAPDLLSTALDLLNDREKLSRQQSGFAAMRGKMEQGTDEYPRQNAAKCVLSYLSSFSDD